MKVEIRHIEAAESVPFTECHFSELQEVISLVRYSGGIYLAGEDVAPFHSYQLVLSDEKAYAEIIVGEE